MTRPQLFCSDLPHPTPPCSLLPYPLLRPALPCPPLSALWPRPGPDHFTHLGVPNTVWDTHSTEHPPSCGCYCLTLRLLLLGPAAATPWP